MKKILFTLILAVFISANGIAQEKLTWHTDMNEAFEIATKENKTLMLFFTGSDWCGWCKRLQKEVLNTNDFENWAKDKVVLVELDFPRRTPQDPTVKAQNSQMQRMFKVRGYPTIHFAKPEITSEGSKNLSSLGSTGYVRGGTQKWLDVANNIVKVN